MLITIGPNLFLMLYLLLMHYAYIIRSRTYQPGSWFTVLYLENLLFGGVLYLLIDKTRILHKGDGWLFVTGLLPALFLSGGKWTSVTYRMLMHLPGWMFHGEPHTLILFSVYLCLLARLWRGREKV